MNRKLNFHCVDGMFLFNDKNKQEAENSEAVPPYLLNEMFLHREQFVVQGAATQIVPDRQLPLHTSHLGDSFRN